MLLLIKTGSAKTPHSTVKSLTYVQGGKAFCLNDVGWLTQEISQSDKRSTCAVLLLGRASRDDPAIRGCRRGVDQHAHSPWEPDRSRTRLFAGRVVQSDVRGAGLKGLNI